MKLKTALDLALKRAPMTTDEFDSLPKHVAIIMDGNGRWAKKHTLSVARGHRLCEEVCKAAGTFIWCDCYPEGIVDASQMEREYEYPMPMGLYMRPSWIDR